MTTVPARLPVTRPFASTVAISAFAVVQPKVTPVNTLPCASRAVAIRAVVSFAATETVCGVTLTVSMLMLAGWTTSAAVPVTPSLVAAIVVVPDATDSASPVGSIDATAVVDDVQVIGRPTITKSLRSRAVAVKSRVAPRARNVSTAGDTSMRAMVCNTVARAAPETVPILAITSVLPLPSAVSRPSVATRATATFWVDQVTTALGRTLPA
jgi:hypothetical protein